LRITHLRAPARRSKEDGALAAAPSHPLQL
jgi:hypothetical protein